MIMHFYFNIFDVCYVSFKQTVPVDYESINGLDSGAWKKSNLQQQHAQPTCCQASSELAQVTVLHKHTVRAKYLRTTCF